MNPDRDWWEAEAVAAEAAGDMARARYLRAQIAYRDAKDQGETDRAATRAGREAEDEPPTPEPPAWLEDDPGDEPDWGTLNS
jgi:hypothetical protein